MLLCKSAIGARTSEANMICPMRVSAWSFHGPQAGLVMLQAVSKVKSCRALALYTSYLEHFPKFDFLGLFCILNAKPALVLCILVIIS